MHRKPRRPAVFVGPAVVGLLTLGLAACDTVRIVQGECRPVHGADVCAFSETSGSSVLAFGATVPIGAIENAPADAPMVWPPAAAATISLGESVSAATGFKVMTIFWEAHGHPPGPYLQPHFDFHFYTKTAAEIEAIDCADTTKPAQAPAAYELPDVNIPGIGDLPGLCVPKMGMHALPASEMSSPAPFQKTMVVGYYKSEPIFVEPMLTRAALLERQSFTLDMPAVPGTPAGARYPNAFRADYDSTAQAYRFVFTLPPG